MINIYLSAIAKLLKISFVLEKFPHCIYLFIQNYLLISIIILLDKIIYSFNKSVVTGSYNSRKISRLSEK